MDRRAAPSVGENVSSQAPNSEVKRYLVGRVYPPTLSTPQKEMSRRISAKRLDRT